MATDFWPKNISFSDHFHQSVKKVSYGYISFSEKYEKLDQNLAAYQTCGSGREVTTEEDCREAARDLGIPLGKQSWQTWDPSLVTGLRGPDWFSYDSQYGLPYCLTYNPPPYRPYTPFTMFFNRRNVTIRDTRDSSGRQYFYPTSIGSVAVCLKGKKTPTNPGKSSFRRARIS